MIFLPSGLGIVAPASAGGDPYWANVVSLLHFDGTDGSTTFTDETGRTWTGAGTAQLDTAQSKFGPSSLLLTPSTDYISTADSDDFHFADGDFTIECFYRPDVDLSTTNGVHTIIAQWGNTNRGFAMWLYDNGATVGMQFSYSTTGADSTNVVLAPVSVPVDTWTHLSVCRDGANLRAFVAGTQVGATHNIGAASLYNSGRQISIGNTEDADYPGRGWYDEMRVTKGVARYTSNFTPPTEAFPNS